MVDKSLEKEFQYFLEHHDELVEKYNGKHIVIKNQTVTGVYDTKKEAILETRKAEPVGTFIVQLCTPGDSAYTVRFHTRRAAFV